MQQEGLTLFSNAAFDAVAIEASAGRLIALNHLLSALPSDFPTAVDQLDFILRRVQHEWKAIWF